MSNLTVAIGSPTITTQPVGQSITTGQSFTLSVVASGANLSYQWAFGNQNISGATSATYSVSSASSANAGGYTVTVSNTLGSVTSNGAWIYVTAASSSSGGSGGGGGGGGAPSDYFLGALLALGLWRKFSR